MPDAGPVWLDAEIVLELNRQVLRFSDEAFEYIVALSTGEIDADAFGDWLASLTRKQS
jgi:hypothetical protein